MKKLIVALLVSLAAALAAQPLAEAGVEKIVYYACYFDGGCGIIMADPDGSDTVPVAGGDGGGNPALSPDGSKIAFDGGEIYVLSLGDGILTNPQQQSGPRLGRRVVSGWCADRLRERSRRAL